MKRVFASILAFLVVAALWGVAALLSAAALLAFAGDTPVLIQDTLNLQSPYAYNGVITVSWPSFMAAGGTQVAKGSRDFIITNGAVSISLYATAGASPSFLYSARFRSTDASTSGVTDTQTWYVPAGGPYTLADVRRSSTMGISFTYTGPYAGRPIKPHVNDTILVTDAASTGSCSGATGSAYAICTWNNSAWVASGGGGSGSSGITTWGGSTATWGGQ